MSGPWRPKIYQGQSLAKQIEETSKEREVERSLASAETRYQPIAPYGGTPHNNTPEKRRIGRACDECRRKKIKCLTIEGSTSCKNCISYKKGCTYNTSAKKRGPPRGYINVLENRLKRIEGLISDMSHDVDQYRQISESTSPNTGNNSSEDDINHNDDDESKSEKEAENSVSHPPVKVFMDAFRESHLSIEGRFISGPSVGYLFSRKIKLMDKKELRRIGIDLQHNENDDYFHIKRMSSLDDKRTDQIDQLVDLGVIRSTSAINNIDDWIWKVAGIEKSLSDRLLKVYFAFIHPLLPVINKVAFLEEYRGIRPCFPAGPLLNAVYGASVRYIENCRKFGDLDRLDNGKPWDFPENFSEMLFQNLIIFIKGKYTPCLSTIQAIVIAHNHSANVESWTSGWLLNCIAVRMSQDIGLHRSSANWNISQQEKETRRMVWWSVYLLDRWFSSGTGRPLTAFDEDCDELYPSENVSIDEIMDTMTETDQHLPRFPSLDERVAAKASDKFIPMNQPFLHLLKLSEILGRILQGLYTPKAKKHSAQHGSDAIVGYLDDALSNWRASLPPLLEISTAGKRSIITEDHTPLLSMSGLICLSYCTLLILLHRPFIEKEGTNGDKEGNSTSKPNKTKLSSQSALTICTSAAIRIVEVSESMHYRDFLMVSWGFALYPVFTAALIHIYNSSNPDSIVSDVAKSNLVRALAVVDKLCLLSPMAASMGNILKKVIALSPIFVNDPDFVTTVNIRMESMEKEQSPVNLDPSSVPDVTSDKCNEKIDLSPNSSQNMKRPRRSPEGWAPTEDTEVLRSHWFPKDQHVSKKRALNGAPSINLDDGNWINQLYTPTQTTFDGKDIQNCTATNYNDQSVHNASSALYYTTQQEYQKQNEHSNNNVDVYSIRQFGFNVLNNHNHSTLGNSTTNSTQQHVDYSNISSTSLQQHPYNIPQNASIQSSRSNHQPDSNSSYSGQNVVDSLSIPQQHQHTYPIVPAALFEFSDISNAFFYGGTSSNPINPDGFNYGNDTDPSALFRHRPDNPFWGMPSSMEIEDWHAYLLPHQQQHKQHQK